MKRNIPKFHFLPIALCLLLGIKTAYSQEPNFPKFIHSEEQKLVEHPEDPYVYVSRESMSVSPSFNFSNGNFTCVQVNVNSRGENIVGDAANEPSIAIDPTNPNRMVMGWRQFDDVNNNFRQAGFAYTNDGGQNWIFPGVIEPGVFRSDPVLDVDSEGNFYYNSLGSGFSCQVFRSNGNGTWDNGTPAKGGDKQWMVVDRTEGAGNGNIYAFWNQNYSTCSPGFFTRSVNSGDTYEECTVLPEELRWGTLAVGPQGELYAAGMVGNSEDGKMYVAKSINASNPNQPVSWDFVTEVNLDGRLGGIKGQGTPNPEGLLGQAWVATDNSNGPNRGNVYLLASVGRDSEADLQDVMFARSEDGGLTWSEPVRINDDYIGQGWQWMGTMSVAPDGRIDVIWLDTRQNPLGLKSALYYSYSYDGGISWSKNEQMSDVFDPHLGWPNQEKMGDYFDMVSDENGAHLAWTATFNGEQDVYYGFIPNQMVGIEKLTEKPESYLLQNHPNPFQVSTTFRYSIPNTEKISLIIYDGLGKQIRILVDEIKLPGSYSVIWDGKDQNGKVVSEGIYYFKLQAGAHHLQTKRMIKAGG
ncbi:MAG: FlgD immunoglobulin-like domain containing protein [Saprospiraceae bacterium]